MKRRTLLSAAAWYGGAASNLGISAAETALNDHRIAEISFRAVNLSWPRQVGRNAVKGIHGRGPTKSLVCLLTTDQGAKGWGHIQGDRRSAENLREHITEKKVNELIGPKIGILDDSLRSIDVPLHDLAGVILGQPVWKMMTDAETPLLTKVYSGMIYFDDLDPEEAPKGIKRVLKNCQWDYDYGYRQFKVKIGRGNQWMPAEAGLQRDVDVVKAIHAAFPDVEILVDGNNGFTAETMIRFCQGIGDIPLFWIEEPFHETVKDWTKLKDWLVANGREKTLRADGEAKPDFPVLEALQKQGILDVRLEDICGHGFTRWRKQMPKLIKSGVEISPHTWGSALKTTYAAHFVGAFGHAPTVEGVTTQGGDVNFGENMIVDGQYRPSSEPGFGLRLPEA